MMARSPSSISPTGHVHKSPLQLWNHANVSYALIRFESLWPGRSIDVDRIGNSQDGQEGHCRSCMFWQARRAPTCSWYEWRLRCCAYPGMAHSILRVFQLRSNEASYNIFQCTESEAAVHPVAFLLVTMRRARDRTPESAIVSLRCCWEWFGPSPSDLCMFVHVCLVFDCIA